MSLKPINYVFTIIASVYLFYGCSSNAQKQQKQPNPQSKEQEEAKKQFQVNILTYEVELRKPLAYFIKRMEKFDDKWNHKNVFSEKKQFSKELNQMKELCDSLKNVTDNISLPEFYDVGLKKEEFEVYLSDPKKKFSEALRQYSLFYGSFDRSVNSDDTELSKMYRKNGETAKKKANEEIDKANEDLAYMKKSWKF